MNEKQIPQINEEFLIEEFDNEVLLYTVNDSAALYLNETALLIWNLCKAALSIQDIIVFLEDAYPAHRGTIRKDVSTTIEQLIEIGAMSLDAA